MNNIKIFGTKEKMTQIFKDGKMIGVTPVKFGETSDFFGIQAGDRVRVSAISKGKGFQGVVKRHGFSGGPKTHGQKNRYRAPGSIGNTSPQRVLPGRRMAGRMGGERVSVKNLEVVEINSEKRILMVDGAVPGTIGTKVEIRK